MPWDGSRGRPADLRGDWNWSSVTLPGAGRAVLTVENMGPRRVRPGDVYEHVVKVTNVSGGPVDDVVLTDYMPHSRHAWLEVEPEARRDGDTLVWSLGTLDAGQSTTAHVQGRVAADAVSASACATATYSLRTPPKPYVPPPPPEPVRTARLELSKSMPADSCMYEPIPLRIVVKNVGDGKASGVRVVDQLPEGCSADGKPSLSFEVGDLAPGASKQLTATLRASRTGKITNTARATGAGGLTAEASATTDVWRAQLSLTETVDRESCILGADATFTMTVTNKGQYPARNCTIRSSLSGADVVRSTSQGGVVATPTITWTPGELAPGASATATLRVARHSAGTIECSSSATASCSEPVSAMARSVVTGIPAVLLEVVDDPDPVPVDGQTTYTITVVNQGSAQATDIKVVADIEDSVAFVSASGPTRESVTGGKISFAPLGTLDPKQTVRWTVTVRGVKAADSRFHVAVTTKQTERPVEETEATRIY